ncbi:MAG: hypothetical protein GC185_07685 [Alphaproteobacteria bacterium]|nr:hypothetical protein [Alphaproteobacteria bacterium]
METENPPTKETAEKTAAPAKQDAAAGLCGIVPGVSMHFMSAAFYLTAARLEEIAAQCANDGAPGSGE